MLIDSCLCVFPSSDALMCNSFEFCFDLCLCVCFRVDELGKYVCSMIVSLY